MAKSKRSNRDHAHQHQYPGPDSAVIAAELQALLTPALYAQQASYRQLGLRNRVRELVVNAGGSADFTMARGTKRAGVNTDVSPRRSAMVQSGSSVPASCQPKVFELSITVV